MNIIFIKYIKYKTVIVKLVMMQLNKPANKT